MAKIRTIHLEFLRHGPAHNQLLSPLTQYLGLCGNHGASTVQVVYEHRDFLSRLESLRYRYREKGGAQRRRLELNKTAEELSNMLASVPGLVSALGSDHPGESTVTHLELILSASELAMLPFELAEVPRGCAGGEGNHLLLQTLLPICLTRRVRSVSSENLVWPVKPKILFIIAQHRNMPAVPAKKHTQALLKAVRPWIPPYDPAVPGDLERKTKKILTILSKATVEQIEAACAENVYTHVHILAHGMEDTKLPGRPYGLALHDPLDESEIDVVSGERLASALSPLKRRDTSEVPDELNAVRPTVVTVAACDTGYVNSVIYNNGASLAHALHQAGIPFVVASQFPLSIRGSKHVAELLYGRMLWGEDPRITLQHLRGRLHALSAGTHDWASLVTYAALPDDLELQLKDVQYVQAKEAINITMAYIDQIIDEMKRLRDQNSKSSRETEDMQETVKKLEILVHRVDEAAKRMPTTGEYEVEGAGMLASTSKRKAEAYWNALRIAPKDKDREDFSHQCLNSLKKSLKYYNQAYRESMRESTGAIRMRRSLHWVMGQYLSLRAVLGESFLREHWGAAMVSTHVDLEEAQGESVFWPHGTLAELYLILLAYNPEYVPIEPEEIRKKTLDHIRILLSRAGYDSFAIYSTSRQFKRYIDWWGDEMFESLLARKGRVREVSWIKPGGIVHLAREVVGILTK